MTQIEAVFVNSLRMQGYAVAVFSPEELKGANTYIVEQAMWEAGLQRARELLYPNEDDQ